MHRLFLGSTLALLKKIRRSKYDAYEREGVYQGPVCMGGVRCVGASGLTGEVYRACASWGRCRKHAKGRRSASETVRGNEWPRLMPRGSLIGGV
jgi:hypothetical protein